ncbi:MAG: apolipoprotein N-acyltransferase [Proteobacteria bacterium]|nr:MAG: apolipoprotein N-acyltransferase [Pseudomonadota bacterium]PIE17819.1 MAG: apolipoprotein N-acyltransferase [Pseudomonadota bacterium]
MSAKRETATTKPTETTETKARWPQRGWQRASLAAVAGAMVFLATATFDVWPLGWIAFVPLFFAIQDGTPRRAFLLGWLAGLVTNVGGFYWIPHLLMRFGKLNVMVAWLLFLLLAAYQGLHFGVISWAIQRTRRKIDLPLTLLAPLFLVAAELLMPFIFDWYVAISQAWVVPVIQIADLTGPLGVSALLMISAGVIYDVASARLERRPLPLKPALIGMGLIAAALVYGQVRIAQVDALRAKAEKVKVGVVQANIGIIQKGRARLALKHHILHLRESWKLQEAGAELLIWPESSYPWAIARERTHDYAERDRRKVMRQLKVPLIFGAITYGLKERYPYNSAFMMSPEGNILGRFDKNYLLVFGEYIPFYNTFPKFKTWFPAASHFNHGKEVTTFPFRGKRIAPLICYEDLLPRFTRRLAKLRPNLLVNITNDAWFGATSEPYEHMALAVFRAVELRLDLVRSVNTGVTSVISANGRILSQTGAHDPVIEPGVKPERLLEDVRLMPGSKTVYTEIGDVFGYSALVASLLLLLGVPLYTRRRGITASLTPTAPAASVGAAPSSSSEGAALRKAHRKPKRSKKKTKRA